MSEGPLRGINLPSQRMYPADMVTWEAHYGDGHVLREAEGALYREIDRPRLVSFKLVYPGEVLFDLHVEGGDAQSRLVYRRRTALSIGEGRVPLGFLLGWVPDKLFWFSPKDFSYRMSDAFVIGDPDFHPVPCLVSEGEHWDKLLPDNLRVPA